MTKLKLLGLIGDFAQGKISDDALLTAVDAYTEALIAAKPPVSGALPPDSEVEKWFAGEKVDDAKFWSDAPFRENGDVVGIVIDALKYFMSGND